MMILETQLPSDLTPYAGAVIFISICCVLIWVFVPIDPLPIAPAPAPAPAPDNITLPVVELRTSAEALSKVQECGAAMVMGVPWQCAETSGCEVYGNKCVTKCSVLKTQDACDATSGCSFDTATSACTWPPPQCSAITSQVRRAPLYVHTPPPP